MTGSASRFGGPVVRAGSRGQRRFRGLFAIAVVICVLWSVMVSALIVLPVNASAPEVAVTAQPLDTELQKMVKQALTDLLERQGPESFAADDVEVLVAERVTWRSGAMGCPLPDRGYPMVLRPGVRIVLRAAGADYEYHGSQRGTPFLCEPPGTIETPAPAINTPSSDPT